jgi:hypothetical protein
MATKASTHKEANSFAMGETFNVCEGISVERKFSGWATTAHGFNLSMIMVTTDATREWMKVGLTSALECLAGFLSNPWETISAEAPKCIAPVIVVVPHLLYLSLHHVAIDYWISLFRPELESWLSHFIDCVLISLHPQRSCKRTNQRCSNEDKSTIKATYTY